MDYWKENLIHHTKAKPGSKHGQYYGYCPLCNRPGKQKKRCLSFNTETKPFPLIHCFKGCDVQQLIGSLYYNKCWPFGRKQ